MSRRKSELRNELKFRRQYIIGPHIYSPNDHWGSQKLDHQLYLSHHKDVGCHLKRENGRSVTLIGKAINCLHPYLSRKQVVHKLINQFSDIQSVIDASKPLAGRWVIICQNAESTYIFTDPCGFRQIYYSTEKPCWCASQPSLINEVKDLTFTSNQALLELRKSSIYKKKESAWVGNKTLYSNCMHLMPNHYLDLTKRKKKRFFPNRKITSTLDINHSAADAAKYLKNIMVGLSHQYDIKVGLSAGYDSRIILAASVDVQDDILFSTDNLGKLKSYHDDIYVPKKLAKKLGLNHILISNTDVKLPHWFLEILSQNISQARVNPPLPKIKSIYYELIKENEEFVLVSGNVTEIIRIDPHAIKFENDYKIRANNELQYLLNFYSYDNDHVKSEIDAWLNSIDESLIPEATLYDMFYWEQRIGNWAALFSSEFDIAAETLNPFNCRLLLETCLKVPRSYRMAPDYPFFERIIKNLWPEVLSEPINPGPRGLGLLKKIMNENLPAYIIKPLRKIM